MASERIDKSFWQFTAGCAVGESPQAIFCATQSKVHAAAGAQMSMFARFADGLWDSIGKMPKWNAIAIAAAPLAGSWIVAALGEGGQVWELDVASGQDTVGQLPRKFGITNLAAVGGGLCACGMGRVVFERANDGSWVDISAPWPTLDEGVIGFTDMAEHPTLGTVAVGWQGEVWTRRAPGPWLQVDTPTNANFNAVDVASDGTIYCVGDKGAVLRGRDGVWETVASGTLLPLQDVCCRGDDVFVASDFSILVLTPQGLVPDDGFDGSDAPATCLRVFSVEGVGLCSVAPNDVFLERDGAWKRID